jgi:ATP adenylyltransferase
MNLTLSFSKFGSLKYEIRICPALQHKPSPDKPLFDAADAGVGGHEDRRRVFDPFSPPYNTQLFVGELKDEASDEEFVVLVSRH